MIDVISVFVIVSLGIAICWKLRRNISWQVYRLVDKILPSVKNFSRHVVRRMIDKTQNNISFQTSIFEELSGFTINNFGNYEDFEREVTRVQKALADYSIEKEDEISQIADWLIQLKRKEQRLFQVLNQINLFVLRRHA